MYRNNYIKQIILLQINKQRLSGLNFWLLQCFKISASECGDSIRNCIINEVKSAKYCSIIADEVTDANREELSLVFRYVHNEDIKEVFVDFLRLRGSPEEC